MNATKNHHHFIFSSISLPLFFSLPTSPSYLPISTYLYLPTYIYLPAEPTYVFLPMSIYLCLSTYVYLPMSIYLCQSTYVYLPTYLAINQYNNTTCTYKMSRPKNPGRKIYGRIITESTKLNSASD